MAVKFLLTYYKKSKSVFKELNQVMFVVELDERASTESEIYSCSSVSTYGTLFLDSELEMLDETVLGASLDLGMRFRVANEQREKIRLWLLSLEEFRRREICCCFTATLGVGQGSIEVV
ncbi:hypothetical protein V6N11_046134 [Hibiscus sabdariffa]|uniref:Uncharacterized protein n=1 Tax=Hibiscus sabdariffa TaxID=183260 RepID=A0ABR1ZJI8_9ROSI